MILNETEFKKKQKVKEAQRLNEKRRNESLMLKKEKKHSDRNKNNQTENG